MAKILIVDDEPRIRDLIRAHLEHEGFSCEEAGDGGAALAALSGGDVDLVILDIMMPFVDGMTCLKEMRSRKITTPVIMLTARGEEYDKLAGLEGGADDYVVKPFGIMELQARVNAVLRRTRREGEDRIIRYRDLEIDPAAREVRRGGEKLELTFKEFELLRLLSSRPGVALTRDEILQTVWDYDYTGETRTVDMHVKTLRQKLGEEYITTVRGVGYKMS